MSRVKDYFEFMEEAERAEWEAFLDQRFQEIQDGEWSKEQTEDAQIVQLPVERK